MEITFLGVRGSIAAPGPEFNRYGGNTPCVAVRSEAGSLFVIDAGTGIVPLGSQLMSGRFGRGEGRATLLLSHTHWDHIQGFPFFAPAFLPGNRITVHGPSASAKVLEGLLEAQMIPPFSPIRSLKNMGATLDFHAVDESWNLSVDDVTVDALPIRHGNVRSLAYRLRQGETTVVYASDASYPEGLPDDVERFFGQATLLIHDCTYTPEDQARHGNRGHSSIADAAQVAARCQVGTLAMFHYDQDYTDEHVDRLAQRCRGLLDAEPDGANVRLVAAREGSTIKL